jgi:tRNA dimethylallyltransferase
MNYNLITILGPTATGKTKLAARLAENFNGEIISADSRQVYKNMDIGTGKDLSDYVTDGVSIQYHLIDIVAPDVEFNLYEFNLHFKNAFENILEKNKIPFLVGGTGLYISSIVQNYQIKKSEYDEEKIKSLSLLSSQELKKILVKVKSKLHNKTDFENKERMIKAILVAESQEEAVLKDLKINSLVLGVKYERAEIRKRTTERLKKRLNEGMIEEVQNLIDQGITFERLMSFGLEYKFIALYIKKELSYNEMFARLNTAIHAFAKRQMTWFRKMEKEDVKINWIDNADPEKAAEIISRHHFISKTKL